MLWWLKYRSLKVVRKDVSSLEVTKFIKKKLFFVDALNFSFNFFYKVVFSCAIFSFSFWSSLHVNLKKCNNTSHFLLWKLPLKLGTTYLSVCLSLTSLSFSLSLSVSSISLNVCIFVFFLKLFLFVGLSFFLSSFLSVFYAKIISLFPVCLCFCKSVCVCVFFLSVCVCAFVCLFFSLYVYFLFLP